MAKQHDEIIRADVAAPAPAWRSFDIDPDLHIPARARRTVDETRTRAFSWRTWFAHGA